MANQRELALHLDLSPQSVTDLVRKGVFIINKGRSPVNIDACRVAYINYLRKAARYTKKDGSGDMAEEKTKLTAAQARKAELEVEIMEGNLIPAESVEETWINYVANARAKLLALPSRVAHQVIAVSKYSEAELIIKQQVHDALNELADNGIPAEHRKSIRPDESSVVAAKES